MRETETCLRPCRVQDGETGAASAAPESEGRPSTVRPTTAIKHASQPRRFTLGTSLTSFRALRLLQGADSTGSLRRREPRSAAAEWTPTRYREVTGGVEIGSRERCPRVAAFLSRPARTAGLVEHEPSDLCVESDRLVQEDRERVVRSVRANRLNRCRPSLLQHRRCVALAVERHVGNGNSHSIGPGRNDCEPTCVVVHDWAAGEADLSAQSGVPLDSEGIGTVDAYGINAGSPASPRLTFTRQATSWRS